GGPAAVILDRDPNGQRLTAQPRLDAERRQLDRADREGDPKWTRLELDGYLHHLRRLRLLLRPCRAARGYGHPRPDGDRLAVRKAGLHRLAYCWLPIDHGL